MWTRVSTTLCVTLLIPSLAHASIWIDNPRSAVIAIDPIVDLDSADTTLARIVWLDEDKEVINEYVPSSPEAIDLAIGYALPNHPTAHYAEPFFPQPVQINGLPAADWFTASSNGEASVRMAESETMSVEALVSHEAFGWRVQRPE